MWSYPWSLNKVYQDILPLAIGYDNTNARSLRLACCGVFGVHAASSECALLR